MSWWQSWGPDSKTLGHQAMLCFYVGWPNFLGSRGL